ncbi:MAG: hypothetical protein A2X61_00465 [Ignavibacteria bacterium GWB2_35_12]|nr:MAG: hypothetical protein A2X61_00465 [Ignavibacteria bacterium GWB2_35_12]OGU91859.1 MAG: hypothetical protein A2220_13205 [Ignavibacteria bacterium RIFOXYA2_FULL_35_10]OGV23627.1 MAG: hypothetical protein A2475_04440 [Ignavibacteria bacterium RIFOXYC2_FULL_35_21]
MTITKDKVTFSRKHWEELRTDEYFREVIEVIEDREQLLKAIEETEYFVDYDEYRKKRLAKIRV